MRALLAIDGLKFRVLVTWKAELKKIGEQTRLALRVKLGGLNIRNNI